MNRARALAAVLFWIGTMLPATAPAQNLEAGKSPGQLFSNNCTDCHRGPRGLLRTVPPGSLPGFLREHYTTSKDMAQQLAGFLIANGATDTRGRPQEARQQPAGAEPPRQPRAGEAEQRTRPRQADPEQQVRPQRPIEQEQAARPPEVPQSVRPDPKEEARLSRRERRAKREAERAARAAATSDSARKDTNRRSRITPARIEAATERGKDALPLGSVVTVDPPAETAKPEAVASPSEESSKPVTTASPSEPSTRSDPVPQVTPAPPTTAEAPTGSSSATETSRGSDDTPPSATKPAAAEPSSSPPVAGPPPAPPISN